MKGRRKRPDCWKAALMAILWAASSAFADGDAQACTASNANDEASERACRIDNGRDTMAEDPNPRSAYQTAKGCSDAEGLCSFWAERGECDKNPNYMKVSCAKSCGTCPLPDGYERAFGLPQNRGSGVTTEAVERRLVEADRYLRTEILPKHPEWMEICQNQHPDCAIWATAGECEANPVYMQRKCAPVCSSCDQVSVETRCPLDPNAPEAWGPGDLDQMFERLISIEPYKTQHQVEVHSRPSYTDEENDGPWIVTLENFLTDEEADRLVELGHLEGYKESTENGKPLTEGGFKEKVSKRRTSTNAWCQFSCYEDPVAQRVIHRLSNLTGIPEENSEFLQLLRYEKGQEYQAHHDYVIHEKERRQGPRILTVFVYLNDVPAGGETEFTWMPGRGTLQITPKKGRVLLWPSVLNEAPATKDPRTQHRAKPVREGVKYGANAWFHLRDFKTPNRNGCQ